MDNKDKNVSAVRLGDKVIIFLNGQRQVVSKKMSPEMFEVVCGYIATNDTKKIVSIFDNFEDKLSKFVSKYFELEEGKMKDVFHKEPNHFSKLLIRKATEMMSKDVDVKPLYKLSKKIFFASKDVSTNANILFNELSVVGITKNGNLLLPLGSDEVYNGKVIGQPLSVGTNEKVVVRKVRANTLSLMLHKKDNKKEVTNYALISPFDIVSFSSGNSSEISISRYKVYKKGDFESLKGVVEVPNENLFDIAYNIFEEKFKNNSNTFD